MSNKVPHRSIESVDLGISNVKEADNIQEILICIL